MSWGKGQSLQEGYDKFVIKNPNGCWDWKGCCPKNPGYGQFRTRLKIERAHRASWLIHIGEIPKGMFVCHTCDNRRCSNPDHLYLATCKQNNLDMMNKNRSSILGKKGENNPRSKLNSENVIVIRDMLKKGISQSEIARKFDVSQSHVSSINSRKVWR